MNQKRTITRSPAAASCDVSGCDRPVVARGWCRTHYQRWRKTGDVQAEKPRRDQINAGECSVGGCDRPVMARGWCNVHYYRWKSTGDVQVDTPIRDRINAGECSVDGCDRLADCRGWCRAHYNRWHATGDVQADTPIIRRGINDAQCSADGCDRKADVAGLCRPHYWRARNGRDTLPLHMRTPTKCSVDGCEKPCRSHGYCQSHYMRWHRYGDPLAGRWHDGRVTHRKSGYVMIRTPEHPAATKAGYVTEHRLVMEQTLGRYLLPEENVHHRNGVRDDNRPDNLELWVTKQPKGQRPEDLVEYARWILARYGTDSERVTVNADENPFASAQ